MRHLTGIFVVWGTLGAVACGGASQNDFSSPFAAGGSPASGGSGAKGGSMSTGGSSSGKGGSSTGGSTSTGGSSSGTSGTDATGGRTATGGTDAAGGSGGTAGTDAAGGTTTTGGTGGSGMTTGGSAGSGMQMGGSSGAGGSQSGAGGSGGMSDCDALSMDYTMTLQQAEACNPNSGKDQCTQKEADDLVCNTCSAFVNPDNADAIAHLDELRKQASTSHCVHPCPALACVLPSATCKAMAGSKTDGRCSTVLATTQ